MFFKIMNHRTYHKIRIPFPFIDVYKITWIKRVQSKIHNHAKFGCVMFLYKGVIKENIYCKNLSLKKTNYYTAPSISYINNKIGYHDIKALKGSKSLHFYLPKGHKTRYFN